MGTRRQQLGHCDDAESEALVAKISAEFDPVKRNDLLTQLNERMTAGDWGD